MNTQFYLDYNATTPLNEGFLKDLAQGKIPFANSSSQHSLGKSAAHYIQEVKDYLFRYFHLSKDEFDIVFHSGATEGSNTFLKGQTVIAYKSDHSCVTKLANSDLIILDINNDGTFSKDLLIAEIKKQDNPILHFTAMHSETGIVWPLDLAFEIKKETGCLVYVDYVQAPGKIQNFEKLNPNLDFYTLSGHKFGALKGIGFTFFKKSLKPNTLIHGGGQQDNLRSGTVNITGIASLKYALADINLNQELKNFKEEIQNILNSNSEIKLISNDSYNTICFIHNSKSSDVMLIHFDLAGLAVSSGSACSSGSLKESETLLSMGFGEKAKNNIRISLGEKNLEDKIEILKKITEVAEKL